MKISFNAMFGEVRAEATAHVEQEKNLNGNTEVVLTFNTGPATFTARVPADVWQAVSTTLVSPTLDW